MHAGGFSQMSHNGFTSQPNLGMPTGGLASRRGGQNIKPLSFDTSKTSTVDNGAPTPRTSRSHLLAGLRTAPKSATTSSFPASATSTMQAPQQMPARNGNASSMYGGQETVYTGPKTSLPRLATQQQQHQVFTPMGYAQQYTADQILAPPELQFDEQVQEQLDPSFYAQLVAANMHLAQQQQLLTQQLASIQAAAQRMNLNGGASLQQQMALQTVYAQQVQVQQQLQLQRQSIAQMQQPQQNVYAYYNPATGKQKYYVEQSQTQYDDAYLDQPATPQNMTFQQATGTTPRVEVSPPPMEPNEKPFFRSNSPPKKMELTAEPTPLPPPSANAFRRGHKKIGSVANQKGLTLSTEDANTNAGPKSGVAFPLSPLANGYGPGQARAGEHPVRQPRGPPSIDELRAKPTAKVEGSKNFAARTRRSAVHNLVRAGLERRKGTSSSSGSMSPVSESAEEAGTPLTDNESDSGRSGSGSLDGDAEPSLASSRTSISGAWGAIGSDRPSSRSKSRKSVESLSSACGSEPGSFANVFKHGAQRKVESPDGQRKAPRLVLTSAEKRKGGVVA